MSHLTILEREEIFKLRIEGKSLSEIGTAIGRHKSVISREVKRNKHHQSGEYSPSGAQKGYEFRFSFSKKRLKLKNQFIRDYVIEKLKLSWSPEQISGRLKIEYPSYSISHESIYQFIYSKHSLRMFKLPKYLRRKHRRRISYVRGRKCKKFLIPNRVPIEERPIQVNERLRIGDWEGDSIVSMKSTASLNTLVERKTGFTLISKLNRKTAEETKNVVISRLISLPEALKKTLTLDNGVENTKHEGITQATRIKCYFANPYHSWERGTNENTNGLIREYFPKGTDFLTVSEKDINYVETLLNTRPRKRLGFKTPLEVLKQELKSVA